MLMNAEYLLNMGFMHGVFVRGLKSWFTVIHNVFNLINELNDSVVTR